MSPSNLPERHLLTPIFYLLLFCSKLPLRHHIRLWRSLVSAGKAGTRLLTQILTQTAKFLCGNSGDNGAKQYFEPERKGQNSAQTDQMDTRAVAHNPEVAGSSPVSATIKTTDFERNRWFFFIFLLFTYFIFLTITLEFNPRMSLLIDSGPKSPLKTVFFLVQNLPHNKAKRSTAGFTASRC